MVRARRVRPDQWPAELHSFALHLPIALRHSPFTWPVLRLLVTFLGITPPSILSARRGSSEGEQRREAGGDLRHPRLGERRDALLSAERGPLLEGPDPGSRLKPITLPPPGRAVANTMPLYRSVISRTVAEAGAGALEDVGLSASMPVGTPATPSSRVRPTPEVCRSAVLITQHTASTGVNCGNHPGSPIALHHPLDRDPWQAVSITQRASPGACRSRVEKSVARTFGS